MANSTKRYFYLDSLKYIFCLMIFWAHFAGVFWTLCDPRPELRPELQLLFTYPLSVLVDSSLALYGFCILSGYLASFKRTNARNLIPQILARYLRFMVPFFFINLAAFILYYTVGYPTLEASALLHNAWLGTYYTHAPTISELLLATFTLDGALNGPLWMMKYILLGSCIIYVYNAVEQALKTHAVSNTTKPAGTASYASAHVDNRIATTTAERYMLALLKGDVRRTVSEDLQVLCTRTWRLLLRLFQFVCLAVFVYSFFHLPEPNFFHVHLVLMGVLLRKLDDRLEAWRERNKKDKHTMLHFLFLLLVLLPLALDGGGLQRVLYPFFRAHVPAIAPVFIWNSYWVMLFSLSVIVGVMNCPPLQRALEWKPLKRIAPMNFAVYLIHFPLIASLSLHLYLRLVNRISYSKLFVILTVVSFAALLLSSWLYERTIGKLQNKIVKKLTARIAT